MRYSETLEATAGYVRLILPLMAKHSIPITPKNYTIWYNYVSGNNSELKKIIDQMSENSEKFTAEVNETLYQRFCAREDETSLHEIRENLRQLILNVFRELAQLSGQAEKYEEFATRSADMLSEDMPIQEIKQVVNKLVDETKTIASSGKAIQHKLNETTQRLEILQREFEDLKTEATVDFLTGVANRKAFDSELLKLAEIAAAENGQVCLLMLDIDHFKKFNDTHGHLIGDEVLRYVSAKIKQLVRGNDFVARYGGEEFAVVLPETPLKGARTVAENIRLSFARNRLTRIKTSKPLGIITVSIGAAQYRSGEAPAELISRADQSLYLAKESGRNRVALETELFD